MDNKIKYFNLTIQLAQSSVRVNKGMVALEVKNRH